MGIKNQWYFIQVIVFSSCFSMIQCAKTFNIDSLDDFTRDYAYKSLEKARTGTLYNISLPSNFSGIEVSIVRLRSGTFWARGANFSSFEIPPRIIPMPFVKRLSIIYDNLGNWSTSYFQVPGYSLVTPIIGFLLYDASNFTSTGSHKLALSVGNDTIAIRVPPIRMAENKNATLKCVKFSANQSVELTDMTMPNLCFTKDQGHFSVAVAVPVPMNKKERIWKWWVVGFVGGFLGLILVGLIVMMVYKVVRAKKLGEMERESEHGVVFDSIWIGRSKLPRASMIRTLPSLETERLP